MRKRRATHFADWAADAGHTRLSLAAALDEDEGRIRHYLQGRAIPRPVMLRKLTAFTGLPSDAFLYPFDPNTLIGG